MDEQLNPDDTLPDEAYADTLAELEALVEFTLPDFPMPRGIAVRIRPRGAVDEEE